MIRSPLKYIDDTATNYQLFRNLRVFAHEVPPICSRSIGYLYHYSHVWDKEREELNSIPRSHALNFHLVNASP